MSIVVIAGFSLGLTRHLSWCMNLVDRFRGTFVEMPSLFKLRISAFLNQVSPWSSVDYLLSCFLQNISLSLTETVSRIGTCRSLIYLLPLVISNGIE